MTSDNNAVFKEPKKRKFVITSAPHIRGKDDTTGIMMDVLIALSPAAIMASFYFGVRALAIMTISMASCVLFEFLFQKLMKQRVTVGDYSAVVTGLLLAFNMPSTVPLWMPVVGSLFAIVVVKQVFGGLGANFVNPALAARGFLLMSYTAEMTNFSVIPLAPDAVSGATPLILLQEGFVPTGSDIIAKFLGLTGGCLGEVCSAALIIGGIYLLIRRVISWHIPVTYIATVALLSFFIGRNGPFTDPSTVLYEVLTGGLLLGAIFMATDYVTSPMTKKGMVIFAIGCGILTFVIRAFSSGYPEGVSYSILLMNLVTPLIDKFVKPKVFGVSKRRAA